VGRFDPGYHLVNLLLHAASALLVVEFCKSSKCRAWLAAGIFALHRAGGIGGVDLGTQEHVVGVSIWARRCLLEI